MAIEFGLTDETCNTRFAPLSALWVSYQQNKVLEPLEKVKMAVKNCEYTPTCKLEHNIIE